MDNEIKNLKQKDIENQKLLQISFLELSRVEKKLADLKSSKKHSTIKFYDDKIEAIGNNTQDLQVRLILVESEAAKLLIELEDLREKYNREKSLYDLTFQAKQVELNQLTRLTKQITDYQLALEDSVNKISVAENNSHKWEKLYRNTVERLADLNVKYVEQRSFNNFFNTSYTTFSNFGKISLSLAIIYYSFKIIGKVRNFFKVLLPKKNI